MKPLHNYTCENLETLSHDLLTYYFNENYNDHYRSLVMMRLATNKKVKVKRHMEAKTLLLNLLQLTFNY